MSTNPAPAPVVSGLTWTEADVPRPPRIVNSNGSHPAHAEVGPLLAARISNLLTALIQLEAPDTTRQEAAVFAVPLGDGVIALYAEECTSTDDARDGLVGWIQQVDAGAWSFAGYVHEPKKRRRAARKATS